MRKISAILLLFLCACSVADYHPQLAEQPKNPAKYESDRQECIAQVPEVLKKCQLGNSAFGSFGLIGYMTNKTLSSNNDPCVMERPGIVDYCLRNKGYKIN